MFAITYQIAFVVTMWIISCDGFSSFRGSIPNGFNVPNPCSDASVELWQGVGHLSGGGGGPRNAFGEAFGSNSHSWAEICDLDSDGDGMTNGKELGDPDCEWTVGAEPLGDAISHPGICEPMDDGVCQVQNANIQC